MSALGVIIGGIAAKVGAQMVEKIVSDRFGSAGGALAKTVVTSVAEKLGVEPEAIPSQPPAKVEAAVREVEAELPEKIALWAQGLEGQFSLLKAEMKEGFWQSAWRWGWMYLLAFFWVWRIIIGPAVNASGFGVELVDHAILLTLTTWFISLYMGGHTIKAFSESVADAMKSRGR